MSASDLIDRLSIWSWGDPESAHANARMAVRDLTAAGYRILAPGEPDPETMEKAARVALAIKPEGGGKPIDPRRKHAHRIATAIRSLSKEGA